MSRLQDVLIRGLRIDQPLPTDVSPGTVYVVIDEAFLQEQSDGAFWEQFGPTPGGGGGGGGLDQLTGDVAAGPGTGSQVATIQPGVITNAKLANVPTATIKGRTTAATGVPEDLTPTQALAMLAPFVGDTGTGGVKGLVPAPAVGDGTAGKVLKADGSWATAPGGDTGLLGVLVITALGAGTYTPTSGTTSVIVEQQGGGGGGGGTAATTVGNCAVGSGGSGGGYVRTRLMTGFAGAAYVVGAKGTGGVAGNNAGTAGGATTFSPIGGPPVITAGGGTGGTGSAAQASTLRFRVGVAGGLCTNGDVQIPGGPSTGSITANNFQAARAGGGGGSVFAPATQEVNSFVGPVAGLAAVGHGGGGGGAVGNEASAAAAGGNGSDGLLIIWEYGSPIVMPGITELGGDVVATGSGAVVATLRDSVALSVIGRSANSTGHPTDIAGAVVGDVLQVLAGPTLGFGQPGLVWIAEQTPSGVGTITFSSLGAFTHLRIVFSARCTEAATGTSVQIRFNGDTGANYDGQRADFITAYSGADQIAQTSVIVANITGANSPANYASGGEIMILDYRGSTFFKTAHCTQAGQLAALTANNIHTRVFSGWWRNTAPITSLTLLTTAGNYVAGSKFTLYGMK